MKSARAIQVAAVLFAVFAVPADLASQENQSNPLPRYAVTDLGTLGGTFSLGFSINNKSWITGNATLSGDTAQHAFLDQQGVKTDLGTLGGTTSATQALNQAGQVVGVAESSIPDPMNENFCLFGTGLICLPFLWQNGAIGALPTLGGNNGIAYGLNNQGQAGGVVENSALDSTCSFPEFQSEPVIWNNGVIQQLPTFSGDPDGFVVGLNNQGQAVGGSGDCFTSSAFSLHAVLWQNGAVTDLGNLGGSLFVQGSAINDQGQVVGDSNLPGDTNPLAPFGNSNTHAFLWQNSAITDMGTLPGDSASYAVTINNKGQAVGIGSRAILWQNGAVVDLNSLVPGPPFSPLYLLQAFGINDRGEITGLGLTSNGDLHAFLAVPCDQNHADEAGCNASGRASSVQQAGMSADPAATARTNPGFGVRFGGMRDGPPQQFRRSLIPGPASRPAR